MPNLKYFGAVLIEILSLGREGCTIDAHNWGTRKKNESFLASCSALIILKMEVSVKIGQRNSIMVL